MHGNQSFATRATVYSVAAHIVVCGFTLLWNLAHHPLGRSLYYWWFVPWDLAAILFVTPFYFVPRWLRLGFCINILVSGTEGVAMVYLGLRLLEIPFGIDSAAWAALGGAALVAVRLPVGWMAVARASVLQVPVRECA